jgi:NAD(P)H-dependent flavin oxidoreductase YrpB (nitropropane dioxygenase family)
MSKARRLSTLLPSVADAVKPLPVIAAGGIANGHGLAAALTLGAQAVSLGTRFLCSEEAFAAPAYKERVVQSTAEDTEYRSLFDIGWNAPHRVLRNRAIIEWETAGRPASGGRPGEEMRSAPRPAVERLSNCGNIGRTPIQRAVSTGILRMPCYMPDNPAR